MDFRAECTLGDKWPKQSWRNSGGCMRAFLRAMAETVRVRHLEGETKALTDAGSIPKTGIEIAFWQEVWLPELVGG